MVVAVFLAAAAIFTLLLVTLLQTRCNTTGDCYCGGLFLALLTIVVFTGVVYALTPEHINNSLLYAAVGQFFFSRHI